MPNDELARARAQVRKDRTNVSRKINRILKQTGVEIAGTSEDPRRPTDVIKRYNIPQLRAYERQLESFLSRGNQYVAGANGVPIPRAAYREYQKNVQKLNTIGNMQFEEIADILIPNRGLTVRQYREMRKTTLPTAGGNNTLNPFSREAKRHTQLANKKALAKLNRQLMKDIKSGNNYLPGQRRDMETLLDRIGMAHMKERARALNDTQFNVLWNGGKFGNVGYDLYHLLELLGYGSGDRHSDDEERDYKGRQSQVEDYENDLRDLFSFAESISAENVNQGSKVNSQNRNTRRNQGRRK